jgi:hypothetical protein
VRGEKNSRCWKKSLERTHFRLLVLRCRRFVDCVRPPQTERRLLAPPTKQPRMRMQTSICRNAPLQKRQTTLATLLVRTAMRHEMRRRRCRIFDCSAGIGLDPSPATPGRSGPSGSPLPSCCIVTFRRILRCGWPVGRVQPSNGQKRQRIEAGSRHGVERMQCTGPTRPIYRVMSSHAAAVGLATCRRCRCNATAPLTRPFHCVHSTDGGTHGRPGKVCCAWCGLRPGVWGV